MVVEPDVQGDAQGALVEARPDRRDDAGLVDGHGHAVRAGLQRGRQGADHLQIGRQVGQAPLRCEGVLEARQIARRRGQHRRRHLDVVEAHDRVDLEGPAGQLLAHDLAMHLALRWHVDDHVAAGKRRYRPGAGRRPGRGAGRTRPRPRRAPRGGRRGSMSPSLGSSPRLGWTWQRPHRPRPPHTESMSTPSARPASRTVVPAVEPAAPAGRHEDDQRLRHVAHVGHDAPVPASAGGGPTAAARRRLIRRPCSPSAGASR